MEACIADIGAWMLASKLKLNKSKFQLLIASKSQQAMIRNRSIFTGSECTTSTSTVRNLGVNFDENFTMDAQVKRIRQSVYFNIRNINNIRKILDDKYVPRLMCVLFVLSWLDSGNPVLINIKSYHLDKLEYSLKAAAEI